MNRKFLQDLGLEKDQIDAIMEKNGELIEENKSKIAEKDAKIGELENNIKQRDEDIEKLKNANDKISKEDYEALQNKYKELEKTSKENVDNVRKSFLIDKFLMSSKAKNVEVLKKQLDMSKITLENEEIKGIKEQVEALQKSDSYLFNSDDNNSQKGIKVTDTHDGWQPKKEITNIREALRDAYSK